MPMPVRISLQLLVLMLIAPSFAAEPNQTGQQKSAALQEKVPAGPADSAIQQGDTIAHTLLALELEDTAAPLLWQKLDDLIARAMSGFAQPPPQELEPAKAQRFFRAVDEALIGSGVIFPPKGTVELLRDALEPRRPTEAELRPALQEFANARRSQFIQAARAADDPLYYFDCDLAAMLYVAVAERLKLPVYLVELPGHNFVRWQSTGVTLNWDPNDGIAKSDQHFAQVAGVTAEDRALLGYLENRTPARISSYWLVRRGQRKASAGKFSAALLDYRAAVKTSPEDLVAANELAWLLATSPDQTIRDGQEARAISEKLVARSRRINWLETLAAAWAETGDFPQAVAVEEEARHQAAAWLQSTKRRGSLAGFDACLKAYAQNLSYAAAVKSGLIK